MHASRDTVDWQIDGRINRKKEKKIDMKKKKIGGWRNERLTVREGEKSNHDSQQAKQKIENDNKLVNDIKLINKSFTAAFTKECEANVKVTSPSVAKFYLRQHI